MLNKLKSYKQKINLFNFMKQEEYGFKELKSNTSNSKVLEREEKGNPNIYTIQKNPSNEFVYWTSQDKSLEGKNIIDFVQNNHGTGDDKQMTLEAVSKHLEPFSKDINFNKGNELTIGIAKKNNTGIAKELRYIQALEDRTLLYGKGLSDKTIDNPLFKNLIYNVPGTDPLGIGYIMINQEKVLAINIPTQNKEETELNIGEKQEAIICSKIIDKPPVDTLIVTETMEEAMAHYELNIGGIQSENVRYIATGKEPSLEQLRLIQINIDELNPSTLIIATSNTKEGEFIQNKVLSKLNISPDKKMMNSKTMNFRGFIDLENVNKTGFINITLPKDSPNFQESFEKLMSTIETKQKTYNNLYKEGEPFTVKIDSEGKKDCVVHIMFDDSKTNWNISAELIHEVKFDNHPFIRRDVSHENNFNTDLKTDKEERLENEKNSKLNTDNPKEQNGKNDIEI